MIKLTSEQVKGIQLDILKALHAFCVEHNIMYYLASGTLIGAVRHNGYIPWDDDVDVYMPRPGYDVFLATFNSQNPHIQVSAYELDSTFPYPFAKVFDTNTVLNEPSRLYYKLGVNIDIFPLDGIDPTDIHLLKRQLFLRKLQHIKVARLNKQLGLVKNTGIFLVRLGLSPLPMRFFIKHLIQNAKKYDYSLCQNVAVLSEGADNNYVYDKSVFSGDETHPFEDGLFYIPKGYKEYLTKAYGDYMQLPPVEKRVCHNFDAYRKEV